MNETRKPQFRRLSVAELASLEKEFVEFLVSQSITAEDWQKIKDDQPDQADALIAIFSDIVLQKVLEKIDLLELRSEKDLMFVECTQDHMQLVGMQIEGDTDVDLTEAISKNKLQDVLSSPDIKIQLVSAEKKYRESREREVFAMLEGGYMISQNRHLLDRLKLMQA